MWQIFESNELDKSISALPLEIIKRYEKWKDVVRISGIEGLREIKGFHDEKLKGNLEGLRSSRLSDKYRIIYSFNRGICRVFTIKITVHDYRSK